MNWNAYVNVRGTGKINEAAWREVKKWGDVEQVWSTSGDWDWLVKLSSSVNDWDKVKKFVVTLREQPWVTETHTWWAQAL